MVKLILSTFLIICSLFVFTAQAAAVNIVPACSNTSVGTTTVCKTIKSQTPAKDPIISILKTVIEILGLIIGVASVIVIMVAGLTFIINGSDPQAVNRARNMLLYAVIGVFISILAESIVVFILKTV